MQCPQCQHENSASAKFCEECGQQMRVRCPACGFEPAPSAKFCPECGQRLGAPALPAAGKVAFIPSTAYTPKHLAEKILTSRARPGRRTQAGDGAVCRHQRFHRIDQRPRPRGRPAAH